tara:strand:- start:245 stop:1636 length:1392 start_codon:yes stop_codon:yes gene_type:complete
MCGGASNSIDPQQLLNELELSGIGPSDFSPNMPVCPYTPDGKNVGSKKSLEPTSIFPVLVASDEGFNADVRPMQFGWRSAHSGFFAHQAYCDEEKWKNTTNWPKAIQEGRMAAICVTRFKTNVVTVSSSSGTDALFLLGLWFPKKGKQPSDMFILFTVDARGIPLLAPRAIKAADSGHVVPNQLRSPLIMNGKDALRWINADTDLRTIEGAQDFIDLAVMNLRNNESKLVIPADEKKNGGTPSPSPKKKQKIEASNTAGLIDVTPPLPSPVRPVTIFNCSGVLGGGTPTALSPPVKQESRLLKQEVKKELNLVGNSQDLAIELLDSDSDDDSTSTITYHNNNNNNNSNNNNNNINNSETVEKIQQHIKQIQRITLQNAGSKFLNIFRRIIQNLVDEPTNTTFQSIKTTSKTYENQISSVVGLGKGGGELLTLAGFKLVDILWTCKPPENRQLEILKLILSMLP